MIRILALCTALIAATSGSAAAADEDEPITRVGRVSAVSGNLTVKRPDDTLARVADVNYPVAPGMYFTTSVGGRTELQFGNITTRLDGSTEVDVIALDDAVVSMRVARGRLSMNVDALADDERITVSTNDAQIVFTEPGTYRIDLGDAALALTHVAVLTGKAEIFSPHGTDHVFAGEAIDVDGPHAAIRYGTANALPIDTWRQDNDRDMAHSATDLHVPAEIAGAAELNEAGVWAETTDYGVVWYPRGVPVDWAPYRDGRWAWVAPWGWTWIDRQPWGFAPFHYGRWIQIGGRWGWCPGDLRRHRAYAPALVAFSGSYRPTRYWRPDKWSPLRPGERYRPTYHRADLDRYFRHYRRSLDNLKYTRGIRHEWDVRDRTQRGGRDYVDRDRRNRHIGTWQDRQDGRRGGGAARIDGSRRDRSDWQGRGSWHNRHDGGRGNRSNTHDRRTTHIIKDYRRPGEPRQRDTGNGRGNRNQFVTTSPHRTAPAPARPVVTPMTRPVTPMTRSPAHGVQQGTDRSRLPKYSVTSRPSHGTVPQHNTVGTGNVGKGNTGRGNIGGRSARVPSYGDINAARRGMNYRTGK